MPLPTVEEAFQNMGNVGSDFKMEGFTRRAAELNAAVQLETARTMAAASDALRASIDRFTEASDRGTAELAKWTKSTARWTKGLMLATVGLFVAIVVQTLVMWCGR